MHITEKEYNEFINRVGTIINGSIKKIGIKNTVVEVDGFEAFYGFVSGMLAGNYDIEKIFVDGILKIGGRDFEAFAAMLDKLAALTGEATTIIFTVSEFKKILRA